MIALKLSTLFEMPENELVTVAFSGLQDQVERVLDLLGLALWLTQ
jgi:hypothetical protein